jgi:isopentenyl-diphosphate delta-isomerase
MPMEKIPAWIDGRLQLVGKLDVHRRGLRHKAVSVFVMQGNKTLIQRRALSKYHTPGLWANTCCTHPNWHEEPGDCAARRLNEELGITGLEMVHRDQIEYRAAVGGDLIEHEVVELFVAEAGHDLQVVINPEEVAEAVWIDIDDLADEVIRRPERFTPWLQIYLADHRHSIAPI